MLKRQLGIFLVLLVIFVIVMLVNWSDDEKVELTGQNDTTIASGDNKNENNGPQPIVGLDYAQNSQAIRNPFSLTHETAAETNDEPPTSAPEVAMEENKAITTSPLVAAAMSKEVTSPKISSSEVKKNSETINLHGIMQGENGALAILQVGSSTVLASQGDSLANYQLSKIGDNYVVLQGEQQAKVIKLGEN